MWRRGTINENMDTAAEELTGGSHTGAQNTAKVEGQMPGPVSAASSDFSSSG